MTPQRLTRLSITVFVTVLLGLFLVLFLTADEEATRRCIDKGNDPAVCGWR